MRRPLLPSLRRARTLAVVLGTTAALTLAGCGGGGGARAGSNGGPGSQRTQNGQTLQAYWPLTGLRVTGKPPTHPPVVVKIDNTHASQPQLGLAQADLITEELVEGGLTRLAVFFDTHVPTLVGPVRSMRASDIGLVKPVHGIVVTSGAARPTIARLRAAGVTFRSNDGGAVGFFRESSRRAPYNLLVRLGQLVGTLKKPTSITPPYLPWGKQADFAGRRPAPSITARFGAGHSTVWSYGGGHYTNTNSNAPGSAQFHPDTVVVVRVQTRDAGYTDPAGHFVPESVTTGRGKAFVFHGGKVQRGTWSKSGLTSTWRFASGGRTLRIPTGHTWLEVLPVDAKGGSLRFGR